MAKKIEGFTLIELLVVMSIIAFLLLASLAGLTYGLKKARDTSRQRAITTIQTALLAYYNDNLQFPTGNAAGCTGSTFPVTVNGTTVSVHKCDITTLVGLNSYGNAPASNSSSAPLAKYFEEGFRSPIAIPSDGSKDLDNAMAYYVTDDGTQYALCTLTELKSSGNVQYSNSAHNWGCFCDGPLGAAVACHGLVNPTGSSNQ